jgi:hypothetical protein
VKILNRQGDWYQIEGNGFKGFIYSAFLIDTTDLPEIDFPAAPHPDQHAEAEEVVFMRIVWIYMKCRRMEQW